MVMLGLDLSLSSSGWALPPAEPDGPVLTGTLRPAASSTGAARLSWLAGQVGLLVSGEHPALTGGPSGRRVSSVVLEGYSFGSKGRATFSVGELGGAVRVLLFDAGVPFVEVSPAVLKKFATGSGQASKDEVLLAAARRAGGLFVGMSNDEADAFWLLQAGLIGTGGSAVVDVPAAHRAALSQVDWSPLGGTAALGV